MRIFAERGIKANGKVLPLNEFKLFTDMAERLSSGPAAKAAPFLSAFGLYLAAQALMGMF